MLSPDDMAVSSKVDALAEQLRRIAHERGPDSKMPTAREIRDALGVGMSTVNDALELLEARNVIYRKHGVGIFVSPQLHRKTIAVLMDEVFFRAPGMSPFWTILWGLLVHEAESRAETRDEAFSFHLVTAEQADGPLPEMLARSIQSGQVHGILGIGLSERVNRWLRSSKIPCVVFAGSSDYMVRLDGTAVIRQGVYALADNGCQRIALWRPVTAFRPTSLEYIVHPEEIGAFTEALHERGLPLIPRQVRQTLHLLTGQEPKTTLTHQEQGYLLATEVFTAPEADKERPDGIVFTDDMMTWGAITALNRLAVRVGTDVQIATHSNKGSHVLFGYEDVITEIQVDPEEIARAMFRLLDEALDGKAAPGAIVDLDARRRPTPQTPDPR
jgi:DNA-binding LacI/PurR family transcriptional regulator